ncbi:trithorax group protein osa isoform X5 [Spodoptera frugiperda]|uniref:Trithorax group protein osa isoform X5 n=1 Tax=Spodoptera frugiperda TaxID=7108 RepID=A0A9R0ERJ4_SPOFR|nr:trithorax group protein osa isoform X5 [Spodoptera frugiperda]
MAATQAESQRSEANVEQNPSEQLSESRNALLQNGTDKSVGRVPPDGVVNTKSKSPMSAEPGQPRDSGEAPGHDRGVDRPVTDQYGQYRYPEGADPYYAPRPGFPGKPRPPPQQPRFFPGQAVSQAPGPTPTLNSLLQSSGAPPHRYPNSYEQPPAGYGPAPGWPQHRPMPPYNPQGSPYRNSTPPRGYGGPPYAGAPGGPQQPPGAYGPPGSYPQRYPPPGPPGAPNSRPPFSPHQGYERGGSPQPPTQPPGAPSPGAGQSAPGAMSPTQDTQHPPHMPPHGAQPPPHQGYPPPPRPAQPSTPNAHDPDSDLTGQNSNDSGGSGGAGRATTPHLRPTPSPTGSSGSRSMSPAVGTQNVAMPPRTSSSLSDGSGPTARPGPGGAAGAPTPGGGPPPGAMVAQPYAHHPGYKPPHYPPPQPYGYPPRNHHPYPYGYRPPPPPHPPQHYPPPLKQQPRHMGPPGPGGPGTPGAPEGAMPPPTAPAEPHDNGPAAPATALVTTGPDGAPLDEGSQQSTLSNASAASGEEACGGGSGSSKGGSRKEYGAGSAAPSPSPGGGSHSSLHDDYDASPSSWPRPPSSPVFNSHIAPESYRSKAENSRRRIGESSSGPKSDSLGKLYEMDDAPERRGWVERLLAFMDERRTPIAACPTISKQPLDLYRLYLLVRDRGGFVEVTKNKTWKDIAGLLGIGASSSAAYTLRKHYTKNLLAYECHFDRGGIDPQPIINQVEASTKKKSGKSNSTSSTGSSNSQESFPSGGGGGAPMDGYGAQYAGYPPQPNHTQGYQQGGYGYEYGSPYQQNRPVYPAYGPDGDRGYRGGSVGAVGGVGGGGGEYQQYGGYGGAYRGAAPGAATPPPAQPYPDYYRAQHPQHPQHPHPPHPQHPQHPQHPPHPPISPQQPPHEMSGGAQSVSNLLNSQLARQLVAPLSPTPRPYYGGGKAIGAGAPPAAGAPRRHPDFAKGEPAYGGAGAAPGPAPGAAGAGAGAAPGARFGAAWGASFPRAPAPPAPAAPWRPQPGAPQPPNWTHPPYSNTPSGGPAWGGAPRPPAQDPYNSTAPSPGSAPVLTAPGQLKRELTFPAECVEAAVPTGEKRRRLTKADVAPVDAWRIMMALKSGLLAETCWALDILNILLFDDNCIGYFGLQHMPGLLDLLLEHFHKSLSDVFDAPSNDEGPWYAPPPSPEPVVKSAKTKREPREPPDPADRVRILNGENYTMESRRRHPVVYKQDDELFAPDDGDEREPLDDDVLEPWQFGGDCAGAAHVLPVFRSEFLHLPFVRVMPGQRAATDPAPEPRVPSPVAEPAPEPEPAPPAATEPSGDNLAPEPMELEPAGRLAVRDPAGVLRRRRLADYEDECYTRDEPSLNLVDETRDALARRCIALSNILRGLTFVPGNEAEFSRSGAFLALAGKLLLLHHEHAPRAARARAYERAARDDADARACCSSLRGGAEWWWDALAQLREDALVCCANIAGGVELAGQPEAVARPLLDGLLHWAVCPAAVAGDAPPAAAAGSPLSPRRLALEALCKLCVTDANVDLVLATPPRGRLAALCAGLARDLCRPERPVVREFAVNLLHYLAGAGGAAAREVALHAPAVAQLVAFIERAEQTALGVANQHGVAALRDNPDAMGTSLDMLRRAAATLLRLAEHPENRPLIRRHERRLLSLVMSQILDQKVAHELADVLFHCSQSRADAEPE